MLEFNISQIPAFEDNYIYHITGKNISILIDPGKGVLIDKVDYILCTHHHLDHIGGIEKIKKRTYCQILGPKDVKIPNIDLFVEEKMNLGPFRIEVLFVPGHTKTHVAYFFPKYEALFTGDTLFTGGCGRLFEATAEEMFFSLKKISSLPKTTQIFCGHEYTEINLQFALFLEPNNLILQKRMEETLFKRKKNLSTVPSTLELELQTNPFLRTSELKKNLNMENATELEVFTHIRKLKDNFS